MTERIVPDAGADGVAVEGMVNKAGLALFGYFGNDPVQAGWHLRADQADVGVEQAGGWIQRAVALVAFLRGFRPSYSTEDPREAEMAAKEV